MAESIRIAREGDEAALALLAAQLVGQNVDASSMRERLARVRTERIGEVFVAQADDGRVLGWAHVVPRLQLEHEPYAELAGLVVDEAARSTGLGAALLGAAEDWARERGFVTMLVRSRVTRQRAHRFYEREGYERFKESAVFRKALG
jgi:GNAT superfamily N-acetyltransferase